MSKPTFGYWALRGIAHYNRLLLRYLGVAFEDKQYHFGPAPDFSRDEWLNLKFTLGLEFPNLPYFIDGDVKLTESKAILKYIARTRGPELVPTDALSLAKADMVEGVVQDIFLHVINKTFGKTDDKLAETLKQKLEDLNKYLNDKKFALGDKITYVDFFLYEVLCHIRKFQTKYEADILKAYANLTEFLKNFESLPKLADQIKADENFPFYGPHAKYLY